MPARVETPIEIAYNALMSELGRLLVEWTGDPGAISYPTRDLIHHVAHAAMIEAPFKDADDGDRVLAHEAFLSVITVAQLLARAHEDRLGPPALIDRTRALVTALLDALAPHVSRADTGLRATCVDGIPLDEVLGDLELKR